MKSLPALRKTITTCEKCPRLRSWCTRVAQEKRKMYMHETYWGKPVAGFGDHRAKIMIIGLAPAAHGANRTGRMFTGDRSGQWLFRAIYHAGLSNQPTYEQAGDGLILDKVWITNIVRCAPPENKPTTEEKNNCLPYFQHELLLLKDLTTIITLGSIAWDGLWKALNNLHPKQGPNKKPKFAHNAHYTYDKYNIIGSYHPSQQNTFTGRLTEKMFTQIFTQANTFSQQ